MEELHSQENTGEKEIKNITPVIKPVTLDSLGNDINETSLGIKKQDEIILNIKTKVSNVRHDMGLSGEESNIPSVNFNVNTKKELENKKIELENKLQELLKSNVSEKYQDIINKVKQSKIDWAQSGELTRRLKLKGATDEDVLQVKNWLIDNTSTAKTFILPSNNFNEVVSVLYEMTGEENLKEGSAFHVPGGRTDVPDFIKSSVFIKEKPSRPPLPGQEIKSTETINIDEVHHEFGHVAQDGLLDSELYQDWKPSFKEGAPDKEYVGLINETDTRIQSMYRDLGETFNPQNEVFGKKQLEALKEKMARGMLNKDTKDIFEHYDDATIIKLANRMPAI